MTYNGKWAEACNQLDLPSMAADELRGLYTKYLVRKKMDGFQEKGPIADFLVF